MSQAGDGKGGLPPQAFAGYDRKRLRRFYTTAGVTTAGGRWQVVLDNKPILTPGRVPLLLPTPELAEAIAAEWREQGDEVLPQTMLLTRLANSTIDGVAGREDEVIDDILRYAASDLVSYRADGPDRLRDVQAASWDPVVEWARRDLDAPIIVTFGIMPIMQPPTVIEALRPVVSRHPAFPLAALHSMTTLSGSALLALAYALGRLPAEDIWKAAHVDEDWQIETWGEDAEAVRRRAARWLEMQAASRFFQLAACGI